MSDFVGSLPTTPTTFEMISFNRDIFKLGANSLNQVDRIIFMVSGGVDSIAASHYLFSRYSNNNIVYHFNHKLRDQNDRMQEVVEQYHHKNSDLFDIDIGVTSSGSKTEDECRNLRFEYLNAKYANSLIITAHHLDDCVESYLLNCFRGKEGYIPIPFITKTNNNLIAHPFIFTQKLDLIQYSKDNDLDQFVVEDETNHKIRGSRRNLIRKEIIPILERETMGLRTIVKKKMKDRLKKVLIDV